MVTEDCDAPVCVLVVDKDEIARAGLVAWLASDPQFSVVGEVGIGGEILAQRLRPDLIVVDPGLDGDLDLSLIAALVSASPGSYLCVYTADYDPATLIELTLHGVDGYLLKRKTSSLDVRRSLATLGRTGILQVDRHIVLVGRGTLVGKVTVRATGPSLPALSGREVRVLRHIVEGKTRHQVAELEGIGARTVDRVMEMLFEKFDVESSTELVHRATILGIVL